MIFSVFSISAKIFVLSLTWVFRHFATNTMANWGKRLKTTSSFTLNGKDVYRLQVPFVIQNFAQQLRDDGKLKTITSTPTSSATVVGTRGAESSWVVKLDYSSGRYALVHLLFRTATDIKLQVERRLILQCPVPDESDISGVVTEKPGIRFTNNKITPLSQIDVEIFLLNANDALFNGKDLHMYADVLFKIISPMEKHAGKTTNLLLNFLNAEYEAPFQSDFVLVGSDGVEVKSHKFILALISPVFRAMFDTDCQETRDSICRIEDVDAEGIRGMLDCVFGKHSTLMGTALVLKVFKLADKYQIATLKQQCVSKLSTEIEMDTVVDIALLADLHDAQALKNEAFIFLEDNLEEAIVSNAIMKLKEAGVVANRPLYEEWQAHVHLRKTGEPLKRQSEESASSQESNKRRKD